MAKHLGTAHSELVVSSADALALVPEFPYWFDEPFAIRSQIPAMMVSRLARRDVTVALSGDGGDELFGGYPGYKIVRAVHGATAGLPPTAAPAGGGPGRRLDRRHHRSCTGSFHRRNRPGLLDQSCRQITGVLRDGGGISEYTPSSTVPSPSRPPLGGREWGAPDALAGAGAPRHRHRPDRPHGLFCTLGTLVDGSLAKWDRASMACSLEVRVPFLDHRVVEFAWRLPPALKYRQ